MNAESILRCPCEKKAKIEKVDNAYQCVLLECQHHCVGYGFRTTNKNKPILISSHRCNTIFNEDVQISQIERTTGKLDTIKNWFKKSNKKSYENGRLFVDKLPRTTNKSSVLVIGGATRGAGTELLYDKDDIQVLSCDVYDTHSVDVLCDAHYLPFEDESFDGVWIQAVLEHVVEPKTVVDEIHRILRDGGVVYSETPFLQQVHEGCYDFTRFTMLGHRYLFRKFDDIKCGVLDGPGEVFIWNVRYLVWGITRSKIFSKIISLIMSPVRFLLNLCIPDQFSYDNCSGVFFLGKKNQCTPLTHKDIIHFYKGVIK